MKNNKGFAPILIVIAVVAVLVIGGIGYFAGKSSSPVLMQNPENNVTEPIVVIFPSAGTTLNEGNTYNITWMNNSKDVFQLRLENENVGSIRIGDITPGQTSLAWKVPSILSYTSTADNYKGEKPPIDGYKIVFSTFTQDSTGKMVDNKTYSSANFMIVSAPVSEILPTPYISAQSGWPPVIKNSSAVYSCTTGSYKPIERWERTINGKKYCVKTEGDAAAGHIYNTYTYTTANGSGTKTTNFTLIYQNCANIEEPALTQCLNAQSGFSLDAIIASLM